MKSAKQPAKRTSKGNTYLAVAECRLKDCKALLKAARWDAAVYVAGYVIECRLKYAITKFQGSANLPQQYASGGKGHEWDFLLHASGLKLDLEASQTATAYSVLKDDWEPGLRYAVNKFDRSKADKFCTLVSAVYDWLKESCP